MNELELKLSLNEFDQLHERAETRRNNIMVETVLLQHLLADYSAMLGRLQSKGVIIVEPDQRQRRRLNNS